MTVNATKFASKSKADAVAEANNKGADGCFYFVEVAGAFFVVSYFEDGSKFTL